MKQFPFNLLLKKRFYFSVFLFGFLWFFYDFAEMRMSDQTFVDLLNKNPFGYEATVDYYEIGDRRLRYVEIGQDSLPLIVFVHGAPSSSAFWRDLLRDSILLSEAKLMAVDRPGYGYSGFGRAVTNVAKQAAMIAEVIREKRDDHETIVLHGSSYGGTVVARLAMDFPELMDGILLQSASLAPGEEKTYWISYPTSHWALKWLVPGPLRVANAEKLSHRKQLESMAPLWDSIKTASIVLHGLADELIYPVNANYAKERLQNASFLEVNFVEESGHDLLWTGRPLLIKSLQKLIDLEEDLLVNN